MAEPQVELPVQEDVKEDEIEEVVKPTSKAKTQTED